MLNHTGIVIMAKQLTELTKNYNVLDLTDILTFGKYTGQTVLSVLVDDPSYIVWMDKNGKWKLKTRIVETAQQAVNATALEADIRRNDLLSSFYDQFEDLRDY